MKTMTCKELGGACDKTFTAETFEELVNMSKAHGMEMFFAQDPDHMAVIMHVQSLMADPEKMAAWMQEKKDLFDAR